ncbi:hypothetical protein MPS01_13680 [Marinilactibacillus psychrotolerans]|uniref:Phage protein n=1 Tax=Marinilactibacillus psychrotolerans TaxID=191770 RepID=A0AAV3WV49_9LACT|nr:hypothetical protein MPS01_13680 [Marinilactibacillus psychrotolerans]GEQ36017.1 hypothetical protein M132T_15250 [Marinilactibacillus psychrotolerans]SDC59895.1 hypothetical protein SAMN04488013_10729 [Marinilactibacillus psychrotolerans]
MTPTQYLILFFLALAGIVFVISALYQLYKLDKQIKELEKENESLRCIWRRVEESNHNRN